MKNFIKNIIILYSVTFFCTFMVYFEMADGRWQMADDGGRMAEDGGRMQNLITNFDEKMFDRLLIHQLSPGVPLVIFGARGVGKTTLVNQWAKNFTTNLYLDLSVAADQRIFAKDLPWQETLQSIYFLKDKAPHGNRNLLFLDEIQHCPEAIKWLLQAPENMTRLTLVATASVFSPLFSGLLIQKRTAPRMLYLHPLTFIEFLQATGDSEAMETMKEVPAPASASEKLLRYFHIYTLIGGMPEIVKTYLPERHLTGLKPVYEHILKTYLEDIDNAHYASGRRNILQFTLQNAFPFAATRIKFNGFGNSGFRSRETGAAFRTLEDRFILKLVYPSTRVTVPAIPERTKFPRLQFLDTGLVNYFSGIQKQLYQSPDMSAIFHGQIARQVVGQEILATGNQHDCLTNESDSNPFIPQQGILFWIRDKAQSGAEVDFVLPYDNLLIPVVVKPGEPGRLRSLHQFMDMAPHPYAVRLHAGKLGIQQTRTIQGRKYFLLSLPYFLAGKIREHLEGFRRFVEG
ncbi:MAG: AAA family ATPase [Bacteroidota bacterium]